MKIIGRTTCNNEHFDGAELYLLDLTPTLARLCLQRIERLKDLQAEDRTAYEIYYWASIGWPTFFDREARLAEDEELLDALERDAWQEAPDNLEIPENLEVRTNCDQMIVREGGVIWMAYAKHAYSPIEFRTAEISTGKLTEIAAAKEPT